MAFLPDQDGAAPPQVVHVDPGRERGLAVREDMRVIGRIDREIVDRELGASGIDQWRAVGFVSRIG